MTRPIGVTVSALVIGLLGVAQVAGVAALLVLANKPADGGWFPGLARLFLHLLMLVLLAMAGWGLTTAVGLFRMLSWARYSMMAIAGCMLGFGLLYGGWMFSLVIRSHFHGAGLPGFMIGAASTVFGLMWLLYFGEDTIAWWFSEKHENEFPRQEGFAASMLNLTGVAAPPPRQETPPR